MKITEVTKMQQTRRGVFLREWWGAELPDGTLFMIDDTLSKEQAQAEYEKACKLAVS